MFWLQRHLRCLNLHGLVRFTLQARGELVVCGLVGRQTSLSGGRCGLFRAISVEG